MDLESISYKIKKASFQDALRLNNQEYIITNL